MKKKTRQRSQSGDTSGRSVEPITQDRVANARQMHSYLVGPARSYANAKKSADRKLLKHLVFRKS
jgi:hypothetical protein